VASEVGSTSTSTTPTRPHAYTPTRPLAPSPPRPLPNSPPLHPAVSLITSLSHMTFGFLGFGKMASALIEGMLKASCCQPEEIIAINRHPESAVDDVKELGIRYGTSPRSVVDQTDTIVLGTKPADSLQLLKDVRQYLDGKLLISVAAGINIERLQEAGGHRTRVIRA